MGSERWLLGLAPFLHAGEAFLAVFLDFRDGKIIKGTTIVTRLGDARDGEVLGYC
jgi:hypothetical protein